MKGGGAGLVLTAMLYCVGLIVLSRNKLSLISLFILSLPFVLYFPTGVLYGYPSVEVIFSALNTNLTEVYGYFKAVYTNLVYCIIFLICFVIIFKIGRFDQNFCYIRGTLGVLCISLSLIVSPSGVFDGFIPTLVKSINNVIRYNYIVRQNVEGIDSYNYDSNDLKILIIGESVRKDYMSCYGYKLKTTPFLNTAKGYFFENYISAAPNTRLSLSFSFFKRFSDKTAILDYDKNIINIAKAGGYEITWISNQGRSGFGDDLIYDLAGLADERIFLKNKEFNKEDYDDMELLSLLKLKVKKNTKQLIVLHMIGSHEPVCARVRNYNNFGYHNDLECYVTSMYKLDTFINNVWKIAKENNTNSEILYFSDHGLSVADNRAFHDVDLLEQYKVPFFVLMDLDKQIRVQAKVSGFNFIDIFSNWLGCKADWISSNFKLDSIDKVQPECCAVYFNEYKTLDNITKSQTAIYPKNEFNIERMRLNFDVCNGNIDSSDKGYVTGWVACSFAGGWSPCYKVGIFSIESNKIIDFMLGTPVKRDDVSMYLDSSKANKFGFDLFVRDYRKENYIGYLKLDHDDVVLCKNLKVNN